MYQQATPAEEEMTAPGRRGAASRAKPHGRAGQSRCRWWRGRGVARGLAGCLLLFAITDGGPANAAGAESRGTIRVVTFNLFHGGPWSGLTGDAHNLDARLDMVVVVDPSLISFLEPAGFRVCGVKDDGRWALPCSQLGHVGEHRVEEVVRGRRDQRQGERRARSVSRRAASYGGV